MWWMLAGGMVAVMFGLEARRVLRDRWEDATGLRRYAGYASAQGNRALCVIEIGADGHTHRAGDEGLVATPLETKLSPRPVMLPRRDSGAFIRPHQRRHQIRNYR